MKIMQSLDFDGDKILFLLADKSKFNRIIFEALTDQHYIIYDDGISGKPVNNTYLNRVKHYVSTAEADLTGQITNNATIFRDMYFNEILKNGKTENAKFYNRSVFNLRFNQGWQIDKAKTGVGAEGLNGKMYPKELTPKFKPHWFVGMREYQGRTVSTIDYKTKKSLVYTSKSALGQCYDYVNNFWNELDSSVRCERHAKYDLLGKHVDIAKCKEISPRVIELEKSYVRQLTGLVTFRNAFEMDKAEFMDQLEILNETYNKILLSLIDPNNGITENVVAYTAYYATYHKENNESRSRSFVWNCMFDSLCKLMILSDESYKLVRLRHNKEITSVSIQNGYLIVDDKIKGQVDYADQNCEIVEHANTPYAIVKLREKKVEEIEEVVAEDKTYAVQLNGFRFYNLTSEDFTNLIKENGNEFEIISDNNDNTRVAVNGKIVGAVKNLMNNSNLLGKKLEMISHSSLTYIAKDPSVLSRKSTVVKDASKLECYSGQLDIVCKITGTATTELFVSTEPTSVSYDSTPSEYYSVDNSYIDGVVSFGY